MDIYFYHNTRSQFEQKLTEGKIDESSLYFIEESDGTFTLYKGGKQVGGSYAEIQSLVDRLQLILQDAPEELDTLFEIAEEFENVKELISVLQTELNNHKDNTYTKEEVDDITGNISSLTIDGTHEISLHIVDGNMGYKIKEK